MTEIYLGNDKTEYHLDSGQVLVLTGEEFKELFEARYFIIAELEDTIEDLEAENNKLYVDIGRIRNELWRLQENEKLQEATGGLQ